MKNMLCGLVTGRAYNVVSTSENNNTTGEANNGRRRSIIDLTSLFRDRVPRISRPSQGGSDERRRPTCSFVLMLVGMLTIALGCFILVLQPYDIIFKWKLVFTEGSETFEIWKKPAVELYLRVYLFNVTNTEEFLSGEQDKLNFSEVGPYVYRENLEHSNVTFNDNGTLTMVPLHPLVWVPELSNGLETDLLMLPNIALLSISNVMKDRSYFARMGLNLLIRQTDSNPLVQMTAREFMFGYKSPLVSLGNKFLSSWISFDKLGLIDRMYNFDGDHATVFTGSSDLRQGGLIDTYNGGKTLPHWTGNCSIVTTASDATKFPSFTEPDDHLLFYRKSVCRAVPLVRTGQETVDGLNAFTYKFEENALDNGIHDPKNKCFCRNGNCLQEGLIDVTECYYGFPIAVSYPHFYASDPALQEAVIGMNPDKEKHESIFKIEPKCGLPLDVSVRFQINMALGDISSISRVGRFKDIVLPMLWTEIRMERLPPDLATLFKLYLNVMPIVQQAFIYFMFSLGSCLLIVSIVKALRGNRQRAAPASLNHRPEARVKRCSAYLDNGANSKEMELYYSSLLSGAKESDIV